MEFQGFQNAFPLAVIVPAVLAILLLAWLAYRSDKKIPLPSRIALAVLRASALVLLFLLLMNPVFFTSSEVEMKPEIAVFLDNSESAGITKGTYQGLESYRNLLAELDINNRTNAQLHFYSIGEQSLPFHPDSLNASAPQTNLSEAVTSVLDFNENIKAAVFITDGIITYGINPVFDASLSSIPIYTIAVGDTTNVKDIALTNVITNPIGYANTTHTISAEIRQNGYANHEISVALFSGDELLMEKNIGFETENQVKQVDFEVELEAGGLQQFEIRAQIKPDEWSEQNNNQFFAIDVLDNKRKILHIAFEIHPDVKTLRSIINGDINNELTTLTWLGSNNFIENTPTDEDYDLIIIHGLPASDVTLSFLDNLNAKPVIYLNTFSALSHSGSLNFTPIIETEHTQITRATLVPLAAPTSHPVLELPQINFEQSAPLTAPLHSNLAGIQITPLFSIRAGGLERENPVIAVKEVGNVRQAQVNIWDWYKMAMSSNAMHREFVTSLFANLIAWTAGSPSDQLLQVQPAKHVFSTFEKPAINAMLRNENGELENDAILEIRVTDRGGKSRVFNMKNSGNGNYTIELPQMAEGLYEFEATARKGTREIATKSGEFGISDASSELTNTLRNDELLKQISANSGGSFFVYDSIDGFWDSLQAAGYFETQYQTIERYSYPVRNLLWFIVVVVLLSSEWLVRKYYSLP